MILNDLNELDALTVVTPSAPTSTVTGSWVDLQAYEGVLKLIQLVGTVSGTAPTLDGKIQHSADGSTSDGDVSGLTFTEVTASTNKQSIPVDTRAVHRYIRYVGTIGGSATPTFNMAVVAIGMPKRLGSK